MSELKKTLLMPNTSFEMRGNLNVKEPKIIEKWEKMDLYRLMNEEREGMEEYVLHDGPPYANGNIHCGHMLNRLLKDFVVRFKNMEGYKTPFVFGWDTHGLPIEVQVSKSGVDRKKMDIPSFRKLCEDYALRQVEGQKGQIKRLGCLGDYDHPYLTLDKEYEASQIEVFSSLALQGIIYKGVKPVYWSPSSESALAEAEVEYKDVESRTIYVPFKFEKSDKLELDDASIIIWTTTPWTIPADLAITLNPRFEYGLFQTEKGKFLFLKELLGNLKELLGLGETELLKTYKGQELEGLYVIHPLYPERLSKVITASFVTSETGTGCVHTAPDHGTDDFNACLPHGIKPFCPVDEKGYMQLGENDPLTGLFYAKANDKVIEILEEKGLVLKEVDIVHSYPHDWRTHKPVIYRATPQWFCSIEPIREKLLEKIHELEWHPKWGEAKMEGMIRDRQDWCISRQRAWGVPLPIIYNEDGSPILEKEVFDHIAGIIREQGSNAWFSLSPLELLPPNYKNEKSPNGNYKKETDIMDVWFDSGSSWNGVLRKRGLKYPADLYLEGNDQYRGWFNASLILSLAVTGEAPTRKIATHGWVMDENWAKMSKSSGNGIDPSKIANQLGADILRLYVSSVQYVSDVRMGETIVSAISDQYRKIRNTFKFLLGNLEGYDPKRGETVKLYPVDEWVLGELERVEREVVSSYRLLNFPSVNMALAAYVVDLSNFYLDFAKDILYCERKDSPRREAVLKVLNDIAWALTLMYNPILSFTMDEVYSYLPGHAKLSPQLERMVEIKDLYHTRTKDVYKKFRLLRDIAMKALEDYRAKGEIGSGQEAALKLYVQDDELLKCLRAIDDKRELSRLFGVSQLELLKGEKDEALPSKALGERCERCRLFDVETQDTAEGKLCPRCQKAIMGE